VSISDSITPLPLDPELLGELLEKLPAWVIEQLTNKGTWTHCSIIRTWGVPRFCALNGENVLNAADAITSILMRELANQLGLEEEDEEGIGREKD
jgi:hypothetical protein